MVLRQRTGIFTFADSVELVREDQKADLIDGVIYIASPESTDHNKLLTWLLTIMRAFVEDRSLGEIFVHKVAFRLTPINGPEPDLGFVKTERLGSIKRGYVDGPPDLAVELVSADSVERDYDAKRALFEQAGVNEYWILDQDECRATFLVLDDSGFVEKTPVNHIHHSQVLPGFLIDVRQFWQQPLPKTRPIVDRLRSGG